MSLIFVLSIDFLNCIKYFALKVKAFPDLRKSSSSQLFALQIAIDKGLIFDLLIFSSFKVVSFHEYALHWLLGFDLFFFIGFISIFVLFWLPLNTLIGFLFSRSIYLFSMFWMMNVLLITFFHHHAFSTLVYIVQIGTHAVIFGFLSVWYFKIFQFINVNVKINRWLSFRFLIRSLVNVDCTLSILHHQLSSRCPLTNSVMLIIFLTKCSMQFFQIVTFLFYPLLWSKSSAILCWLFISLLHNLFIYIMNIIIRFHQPYLKIWMPSGGHLLFSSTFFNTTMLVSPGFINIENGSYNDLNWLFNLYPDSLIFLY